MMSRLTCGILGITFALASPSVGLGQEPSAAPEQPKPADEGPQPPPRTLPEARRQAELLHLVLHSTLQNVHHELYRLDEGLTLPAAVLEEVFADVEDKQNVKLRWLVVEGQAMNSDHKPKDRFEREAAKALSIGKPSFERVENGVYRHAGPITLGNTCLRCHVPNRRSLEDRTAGLIIAIPVTSP
jgi:hypothetical protein